MNELQIFKYETNEIRTITKDGEPWFVLKDVCDVLEIGNTTDTANRLDEDEKATFDSIECLRKDAVFINESGLYNVILRSNKPEAKKFCKWVTSEVLPSIRKHGMYVTPVKLEELVANPDLIIQIATMLKEERAAKAALEAKNAQLQLVEAKYTAQTADAKDYLYTAGEIAKELGISAVKLNKFLADQRIQFKPQGSDVWNLYVEYAKDDLAQTILFELDTGYTKKQLRWTPKGRDFIYDICEREVPEWYNG